VLLRTVVVNAYTRIASHGNRECGGKTLRVPDGHQIPARSGGWVYSGDESQAVTASTDADPLNGVGAINLGEEGAERVLARYLIAGVANQIEPFAVVDTCRCLRSFFQKADRNPFKALATKPFVEVIDLELSSLPENPLKIAQCMAIFLGLTLQTLGKAAKALSLLCLRRDSMCQCGRLA
jgi:hypothetical protein